MQKPFYVYVHRRGDDKSIFYVGMGCVKYRRAHQKSKKHRSEYWHRVAKKHGVFVEIWSYWDTQKEAQDEERKLISFFKDKTSLVNFTDGGEGSLGRKQPERVKQILRSLAKNRLGIDSHRAHRITLWFKSGEKMQFISARVAANFLQVAPCSISEWLSGKYTPDKKHNLKAISSTKRTGEIKITVFEKENQNVRTCTTISEFSAPMADMYAVSETGGNASRTEAQIGI